ncbi:cytochrome-C oxidase-like protein [Geopyxis carbonaria]|nr:cytochrome-C oxidase-like protein [Geopyxis carbonaria]
MIRSLSLRALLPKPSAHSRVSIVQLHRTESTSATTTNRAVSNADLVNIEKRWDDMPPAEQAQIWMSLRDRMVHDWNDLTALEKKASYWISFGAHGPRAVPPPGESWKVFYYVVGACGFSGLIFFGRLLGARPPPKTMTKEWQEASNEYLRQQNVEPITGVSSEGYKGTGMVQTVPLSIEAVQRVETRK